MSHASTDTRKLIVETAERIFRDYTDKASRDRAEAGEFAARLWNVLEENGLTSIGADSETPFADAYSILRVAGRHAAPVPLAESLLANRLWTEIGGAPLDGVTTLAMANMSGDFADVPWARSSRQVLCVAGGGGAQTRLALVETARLGVSPGANMAGEARDDLDFAAAKVDWRTAKRSGAEVEALAALTRAVMGAGCLEAVLSLAVGYAMQRKQFGKAIAGFQAIQHQLAVLAGEVAAAVRAADAAVESMDTERFVLDVAVAKSRVGEAAGKGAEIAHQVHGAIGFTHEHELHQFTRRLWAWRDEYGNEAQWQARLGRVVAARGADGVWAFVSGF